MAINKFQVLNLQLITKLLKNILEIFVIKSWSINANLKRNKLS